MAGNFMVSSMLVTPREVAETAESAIRRASPDFSPNGVDAGRGFSPMAHSEAIEYTGVRIVSLALFRVDIFP